MNAYTRFKLALTEDEPTIKPYDEVAWAKLPDVESTPIEVSLTMLDALHDRWVRVLKEMRDADFRADLPAPAAGLNCGWRILALYAWHGSSCGAHHVAAGSKGMVRMTLLVETGCQPATG